MKTFRVLLSFRGAKLIKRRIRCFLLYLFYNKLVIFIGNEVLYTVFVELCNIPRFHGRFWQVK